MDQKLKTKWMEALRSGDYQQGRLNLRSDENRFCCLGVLCDIIDPTGWDQVPGSARMLHRTEGGYPHPAILAKAGLSRIDARAAAHQNDSNGLSFSEIADWIEGNVF